MRYTCVNGRTFELDINDVQIEFVQRIANLVEDNRVTDAELLALVYGPENPLLESQKTAGYSFVTPAAFESPMFRALLDLVDRKKVALGKLDLEAAAARYTMSVADAAARAGVVESAIRTAIITGRLPAWFREGKNFLDPASVEAFAIARGAPPAQDVLQVVTGSADGASLRISVVGGELEVISKRGSLVSGRVSTFSMIAVITGVKRGDKTTYRYWLLAPDAKPETIALGNMKVAGRFRIVEQYNGPQANEAWRAFKEDIAIGIPMTGEGPSTLPPSARARKP